MDMKHTFPQRALAVKSRTCGAFQPVARIGFQIRESCELTGTDESRDNRRAVKTRLAILVLALLIGACGSKSSDGDGGTNPPGPSPSPTPGDPVTDNVNGNVAAFAYVSHSLNVSRDGTLTVTLTWQGAADLDLYLTAGTCPDVYGTNACERLAVSDQATGNSEVVSRAVRSGEQYKVWVDNNALTPQSYTVQIRIN
jgi:hypothetical protein